jgi:hypothetical protein
MPIPRPQPNNMRHTLATLLRRLADKLEPEWPKIGYIKFDPVEPVTSKTVNELVHYAYEQGLHDANMVRLRTFNDHTR